MASAVLARWHEPDHGIWEARRAPRHHIYTKVMCWVALDRALRTAAATAGSRFRTWDPPPPPSGRKSCARAGTILPTPTPWPTTARTWTPRCCTSASPGCWTSRPALPGHRHGGGTGTARGAHGVPVPVRRRTAGPGGRLPHLHDLADRGLCRGGPDRGGLGPVRPAGQPLRPHRAAAGGVRSRHRNAPGKPPAGVLAPGLHPLRAAAGRAAEKLCAAAPLPSTRPLLQATPSPSRSSLLL